MKFYGISLYFYITEDIEMNIRKAEQILNYLKGHGLLIAVDSNARSKTWYDTITNHRGKVFEEILTIYNLHVVNDRSEPTLETTRGSSYVDLTIVNNQLIRCVTDWTCGKQESCSDHKIITFNHRIVRQEKPSSNNDYAGTRYKTKNGDFRKFKAILASNMQSKFNCENNTGGVEKIDQDLCDKLNLYENVDKLVDTAFSCVMAAFKVSRGAKHAIKKPTVSWWTEELKVLRKRTNSTIAGPKPG
jgi:hypothetical protein